MLRHKINMNARVESGTQILIFSLQQQSKSYILYFFFISYLFAFIVFCLRLLYCSLSVVLFVFHLVRLQGFPFSRRRLRARLALDLRRS